MNFEGFIRNDFEIRSMSFGVNNGPVVLQQLHIPNNLYVKTPHRVVLALSNPTALEVSFLALLGKFCAPYAYLWHAWANHSIGLAWCKNTVKNNL